jgi:hypothetical protein
VLSALYNLYSFEIAPVGSAAVAVNVVFDIVFAVIAGVATGTNAAVFDTANVRVPLAFDAYPEM